VETDCSGLQCDQGAAGDGVLLISGNCEGVVKLLLRMLEKKEGRDERRK
jgi:hypothetical protein